MPNDRWRVVRRIHDIVMVTPIGGFGYLFWDAR